MRNKNFKPQIFFLLAALLLAPIGFLSVPKLAQADCPGPVLLLQAVNDRTGAVLTGNSSDDVQVGDNLTITASAEGDDTGEAPVTAASLSSQYGTFDQGTSPFHNVNLAPTFSKIVHMRVNQTGDLITLRGTSRCQDTHSNGHSIKILPIGTVLSDFSCSVTPISTTIDAGAHTTYLITTTKIGVFSSNVFFSASFSPNSGNLPHLSFTGNGRTPPNTTTAFVTAPTAVTQDTTYGINFTGTGGGKTHNCNVVNLTIRATTVSSNAYTLSVTPVDQDLVRGNSQDYTVTLNCPNGLTGPVTSLSAFSGFDTTSAHLVYSFTRNGSPVTQISCGSTNSLNLNVSNTGGVDQGLYSTPQQRLPKGVTVSGAVAGNRVTGGSSDSTNLEIN